MRRKQKSIYCELSNSPHLSRTGIDGRISDRTKNRFGNFGKVMQPAVFNGVLPGSSAVANRIGHLGDAVHRPSSFIDDRVVYCGVLVFRSTVRLPLTAGQCLRPDHPNDIILAINPKECEDGRATIVREQTSVVMPLRSRHLIFSSPLYIGES